MADTDGKQTFTFMNATSYLKDHRILANGFNKNSFQDTVQTYGEVKNDSDFVRGSDVVAYKVSGLTDNDNYIITITLLYQIMSYGFAQNLYKDADPYCRCTYKSTR